MMKLEISIHIQYNYLKVINTTRSVNNVTLFHLRSCCISTLRYDYSCMTTPMSGLLYSLLVSVTMNLDKQHLRKIGV